MERGGLCDPIIRCTSVKEVNCGSLTHHRGCFHGRGGFESARVLSELPRHEERETKEPMTHSVNKRHLWDPVDP